MKEIRYICLVMSKRYIDKHFNDIKNNANTIETRIDNDYSKETALQENMKYLIDEEYNFDGVWKNIYE